VPLIELDAVSADEVTIQLKWALRPRGYNTAAIDVSRIEDDAAMPRAFDFSCTLAASHASADCRGNSERVPAFVASRYRRIL
jgi:hypothetical protein